MLHRIYQVNFVRAAMLAVVFSLVLIQQVNADVPRALAEGQVPKDKRLAP